MTAPAIEDLLRELTPQVLGTLVRRHGQFEGCEDAVQEAVLAATVQWPDEGVPDNPRGWLTTVASRRLIDQMRSEQARREREWATATEVVPEDVPGTDDTLVLLFLCCHPTLTAASQTALTLRGGRRPDHRRDRPRVPGAGGHDGGQDQPGQAAHQGRRQLVQPAGRRGARGAAAGRPARALPDLQRGLHRLLGQRAAPRRPRARGDPADQDGARAAARGRRGDRAARADAADPRPPGGTDDGGRRPGAAGRAGPREVGPQG